MTNEEALAHFKNHEYMTDFSWQDEISEVAIKAIERQIPKKPKIEDCFTCPSCEYGIVYGDKYCQECGQLICWELEGEV